MFKVVAGLALAGAMLTGAAPASAAGSGIHLIHPERAVRDGLDPWLDAPIHWRGQYAALGKPHASLAQLSRQAATGATVPFWTANVTSPLDGKTYTTSMVGSSPYASTPTLTTMTYVPIVVRVHFRSGLVLDPTKPACGDSVSVSSRFYNSPLFAANSMSSNGVQVVNGGANSQLISAFQRANYWNVSSTFGSSAYGVQLTPSTTTPIVVDMTAPSHSSTVKVSATCGGATGTVTLGEISINAYDSLVQGIIAKYATPNQLPVLLTYNLVQTQNGQCCILGYHSAVSVTAGTQTYAVGSYIDSGVFSGVDDTVIWSHEMGEWMDDPFVQANVSGGGSDDTTPLWGNVGQVSGCQNNLEVGDPLSGTEFAMSGAGGFTYHYQDLAFHDWFYRTASTGAGGKYSFQGVFTSTQPLC